jgi:hypothetical protein
MLPIIAPRQPEMQTELTGDRRPRHRHRRSGVNATERILREITA